jgi:2-methylisocitrate lyase-like PEP mutase family enzyme
MQRSSARRLRDLLGSDGISAAPGAHDCFTARIVERAGHPVVYLGGNAMALGLAKGQPFITLTETAEITARVARAVEVPVLVDAGAGFGEPAHIHVAVCQIANSGAAGLHIDDQPYPKRAGYHRGEGNLVESAVMAARVHTAVAARQNPDFVIIARTDALRVTRSVDETITRCRAYLDAGADALMVLDLGPDQVGRFRQVFPSVPLVWIGGVTPPIPTLAELAQAGFGLACYPFNGVAAATVLLEDLWAGLARCGTIEQDSEMLARARRETLQLVDMPRFWEIESTGGGTGGPA